MATVILIFLIGVAAGFISGMIGGGSGLVLVPVQILLGIDPKIATTTTHFGFIGVSAGALARCNREREIRKQYTIPLTIIAAASGCLGPFLLLSIDPKISQQIVGILILICVPLFLLKKDLGKGKRTSSRPRLLAGYVTFFAIITL